MRPASFLDWVHEGELIFNLKLMPPSLDGNWKAFAVFFLNFNLVVVPCSFVP